MKLSKENLIMIGLLVIQTVFFLFVSKELVLIHYPSKNLFLLELMGWNLSINFIVAIVANLLNLLLLYLIAEKISNIKFPILLPLIYAISPWNMYLASAGSFYIFLLFCILLIIYGLSLLHFGSKTLGSIFLVVGIFLAFFSSPFLLIILPIIYFGLLIFKTIDFKLNKTPFLLTLVLVFLFYFLIFSHQTSFKNILTNELPAFRDPGLINNVNSDFGEAQKSGYSKIAKLSENRYVFTFDQFSLRFLRQLLPSTFFTSQEKLLNFSFSPPIFLGFVIPFMIGIYQLLYSKFKTPVFLSTLLVIPSIFVKNPVDLNRLVIFEPIIIFIVAYGFQYLVTNKKNKVISVFLFLTIFLLVFQFIMTVYDVQINERVRFEKYLGQNYELEKQ